MPNFKVLNDKLMKWINVSSKYTLNPNKQYKKYLALTLWIWSHHKICTDWHFQWKPSCTILVAHTVTSLDFKASSHTATSYIWAFRQPHLGCLQPQRDSSWSAVQPNLRGYRPDHGLGAYILVCVCVGILYLHVFHRHKNWI